MEISNSKTKNGISKCGPRDLETLYTRPTSSTSSTNHASSNSSSSGVDGGVEGSGSGGVSGGGGGGGLTRGKKPKGRTGWPQHVWAQELKPEQTEVTFRSFVGLL